MRSDVYVRDGRLEFVDVKKEHRGVYRCEANNIAGMDYLDFTAKVLCEYQFLHPLDDLSTK